jgi:mycothiol synthase
MTAWAEEIRNPAPGRNDGQRYLTAIALETDLDRSAFLEAAGFEATGHFAARFRLDLSEARPHPTATTDGSTLRAVTADDFARRIDVHRSAWPGSTFDRVRYERIQQAPNYRRELDIVLETADGIFASYCICWYDPGSGIGIFEPVGTHPDWRGRGAGRQVIAEGLRRLQKLGARFAQVETPGFNAPARALYESAGFVQLDTARTFLKAIAS